MFGIFAAFGFSSSTLRRCVVQPLLLRPQMIRVASTFRVSAVNVVLECGIEKICATLAASSAVGAGIGLWLFGHASAFNGTVIDFVINFRSND